MGDTSNLSFLFKKNFIFAHVTFGNKFSNDFILVELHFVFDIHSIVACIFIVLICNFLDFSAKLIIIIIDFWLRAWWSHLSCFLIFILLSKFLNERHVLLIIGILCMVELHFVLCEWGQSTIGVLPKEH